VTHAVLVAHTGATLAMFGLIWFVQIVHYPLFSFVARGDFSRFAAAHQRRTTVVVAPLMLLEAASAVALALAPPAGGAALARLGLALLAVLWVSTAAIQVPAHRRLAAGFSEPVHRRLVASNWLRTLTWTGRAVIALLIAWPSRS
jgi:hypothetical protein